MKHCRYLKKIKIQYYRVKICTVQYSLSLKKSLILVGLSLYTFKTEHQQFAFSCTKLAKKTCKIEHVLTKLLVLIGCKVRLASRCSQCVPSQNCFFSSLISILSFARPLLGHIHFCFLENSYALSL